MEEMLKQAKLKALSLLTDMDRTEEQLRMKLKQKSYPDEIVEQAIAYVKSFGYINDINYAKRFVENKKCMKSRREICAALSQKGVERDVIEKAVEECYGSDDEMNAIRTIMDKRHFLPEESTEVEKKKLYDYLLRKGFHYENIRKVMQVSSWNA